jgi:uncharacterized membrane protein YdjX (TVP38/TMEM64 family)
MTLTRRQLRDRRLWILLAALAAVAVVRLAGLGDLLSLQALAAHREALLRFVDAHTVAAALAYCALYVAIVALCVPVATVMTLTGGFLFGAVGGTLLAVPGAAGGATVVFLLARRVFGEAAVMDRFGETARRLAEGLRRDAVSYMLVLRLVPLFPFILVNLVPAFAGVRPATFVLTTLVGILPATAVYATAGAGLGSVLDAGGGFDFASVLTPQVIAALFGLAALSLAAIPLRRRFARR